MEEEEEEDEEEEEEEEEEGAGEVVEGQFLTFGERSNMSLKMFSLIT